MATRLHPKLLLALSAALALAPSCRDDARQAPAAVSFAIGPGGAPVTLSQMRGKVVLLDFWATWCGPCRESIPDVEKAYRKFRGDGFRVIGISEDAQQTRADVPEFVKQMGMTYPMVFGRDSPEIRRAFPHESIPAMFLIGRDGSVIWKQEGYDPSLDFNALIANAVKK